MNHTDDITMNFRFFFVQLPDIGKKVAALLNMVFHMPKYVDSTLKQ